MSRNRDNHHRRHHWQGSVRGRGIRGDRHRLRGSLLRFTFRAINKEYTRPAFIHDDEVEDAEQTDEADDQAQVPVDKALESVENATQSDDSAQTADAEK